MGTFKKLFASIAAVMIVVSTAPVAVFGQTSWSQEYQDAYAYAYANGITTMSSIDAANLAGTTTRAQAAKMFVEFAKSMGQTADTSASCSFSDLAPIAGTDLAGFAVEACQMGLMGINTNGIFNPNGVLSRAEYGTILSRVLFGDTYNGGNPFYAAHLNALNQAGLMNDLSNPERSIMRGDAFLLLFRASTADLEGVTPGFCSDIETVFACTIDPDGSMGLCPATCIGESETETPGEETEVKAGNLAFSLSSNNPAGTDVPLVSAYVDYMKFSVSSSQDVRLRSVEVRRTGLGSSSDFDKIWIENTAGVVVASPKSLPSSDVVTLTFSAGYTVKSNENLVLVVSHKGTANQGNLNGFSIVAVDSSAVTSSGLPLNGNQMRISNYQAAQLTLTNISSASDIDVGATNVALGEFKLQEGGTTNNKDVQLQAITLRNVGTERASSFANFALYNDGTLVSSSTVVNGEFITFTLVPGFEIKDGLSKNFEVRGDVVEGQNTRTFQLQFREIYHLKAYEKTTGIGVAVVGANTNLSTYTINAGRVSLSTDTTNPVAGNVTFERQGQLALVAKASLEQDVTVTDKFKVFVRANSVVAGTTNSEEIATRLNDNYRNIRLYVNNQLVDTLDTVSYTTVIDNPVVEAGEFYYEFDSVFGLKHGDLIKVTFDVRPSSTATANDSIGFVVSNSSFTNGGLEYANGDVVNSADVAGSVNGNFFTIRAASLTIADNSGYGASTKIVAGTNDAKLAQFVVNAGSASSATVKRLRLRIQVGANANEHQKYTNLSLKVNGTQIGSTVDATNNGSGDMFVTFDGLNEVIAQSAQKTFTLHGNVATNATVANIVVTVQGSANGSTVNDQTGNPVTFGNQAMATYQISGAGTISAAIDGASPSTKLLVAGSTKVEVARFRFQATDEVMEITDLYLANNYTNGSNTPESAADARFGQFEVYVGNATTPIATRSLSNGKLVFEDMTERVVIPANGTVTVVVKANINSVTQDDQTNAQIALALYGAKAISQSRGASVPVGSLATSDDVSALDTAPKAQVSYVRKTVPTFATQSVGTTVLTPGADRVVYRATVVADAAGDVEVSSINFDITETLSGGASSAYKLFVNGVDQATKGSFAASTFTYAAGQELLVGNSAKTIELRATIPTVVQNDFISVRIIEDSAMDAGALAAVAGNTPNVAWSDLSGAPHSALTTDWFNGFKVPGLDTDAITLVR